MAVIILVADGARPDGITSAIATGALPSLARLRAEGALATVTTAFPSVTGPAYAPFLAGRFPGPAGLPGLRWFDRARTRCRRLGHSRSYVGHEIRFIDADLDPGVRTLFELARHPLGALTVITRGLPRRDRVGRGVRFAARTALTHFRGDVNGWLDLDREIAREVVRRVHGGDFDLVVAALTGVDKASHAAGHDAPLVRDALTIVDNLAGELRATLTRAGRWRDTHLWIVSDHGHSPVYAHDDLAAQVAAVAGPVLAHPWLVAPRAQTAVMVGGNAMAHLYMDVANRERRWWPALRRRWAPVAEAVLRRPSVDLLLLPHSPTCCEIRSARLGRAIVARTGDRLAYQPLDGDPLELGELRGLDTTAAHEATRETEYPDALVQIVALAGSRRAGDLIVSGAPGWDLRARYEPIPHASSHGSLRRAHMLVPLLTSRPPRRVPRRTADVFASAVAALGAAAPSEGAGVSYL